MTAISEIDAVERTQEAFPDYVWSPLETVMDFNNDRVMALVGERGPSGRTAFATYHPIRLEVRLYTETEINVVDVSLWRTK